MAMDLRGHRFLLAWGTMLLVLAEVALSEVLMPVLKSPKPFQPAKMPYISPSQMEKAFADAQDKAAKKSSLESQMASQGGTIPRGSRSAKARHQKFTAIDPESVRIDENQAIFEEASKSLVNSFDLTKEQAAHGLDTVDMPHGSNRARQAVQNCRNMFSVGRCNPNYKFRTADGSCNNLDNPTWGRAFSCFARLIPPDYSDGLSSPRRALSGKQLPNPRVVSRRIHNDVHDDSEEYTIMTMQWGQFMDHDLTLTPMTRAGPSMNMIECCQGPGVNHPACFPIEILPNDSIFGPQGQDCLNFVRSAACNANCNLGPRQQSNQLTGYIDASNVYGSEENDTRALREFRGGLLKAQNLRAGELLPPSRDPDNDQCSRPNQNAICFQAGDERVNEQPGLTSMHTIWLRQHNRIARYLQNSHSGASDEDVFQETRRIVGAQLQSITYNEFLPVVLGPDYYDYFNLKPLSSGFTQYDPNTEPTIVQAFSVAAYRFGHTLIANKFNEIDSRGRFTKALKLEENFFFPFTLFDGELDPIVRGLFLSPAEQYDRHVVQAVTNHLYKAPEDPVGMDLPALNLQRSRDHGLQGYTKYIDYCFDLKITSFRQLLRLMPQSNIDLLASVYESVEDIELFSGGISETPLPGGVVGPTFGCIIGLQFYHLKFGDRYYFEHANQAGSFTHDQLNEIRNVRLARVICGNTNINQIAPNVFRPTNTYEYCDNLRELKLSLW